MTKPGTPDAREMFSRAINLHQAGKFSEAEKIYRELIKLLPGLEPLYSTLGAALSSQNKTAEALSALEKALQLNPRSPDALTNIGAVYTQMKQYKKAEDSYRQLIDLFPTMASAHYNLANVLRENKREEDAISSFRKAIELDPSMLQAYQNLAALLQQRGVMDEAIALFKKISSLKNDGGESISRMAYMELEQGRYDEALKHFQSVIAQFPQHAASYAGMGRVFWEQGLQQEALGSLEQAISLQPSDAGSYILLGNVYQELNRVHDTIDAYKKALQLEPENAEAKSNLNRAYMRQISPWHFTMLADTKRNDAYQQAIERAVDPSSKVLDIGTGSGLLSMMAARAGAAKVTACEVVKVLADVAKEIVKANGYADRITVINKKSNRLQIGSDLEKVNVVVSEILDAGLLGEGVIPSLRHALNELAEKDAVVIPQAACVYAALLEIPGPRTVAPVRKISGFDLSAFNRFRMEGEYVTMMLAHIPHRLLSEAIPVYDVDFRKLPAATPDTDPKSTLINIKASAEGSLHAIAFWFELQLDDQLTVSTALGGEMVHWGQAVQFLEKDTDVKAGQEIKLNMLQSDSLIRFELK